MLTLLVIVMIASTQYPIYVKYIQGDVVIGRDYDFRPIKGDEVEITDKKRKIEGIVSRIKVISVRKMQTYIEAEVI